MRNSSGPSMTASALAKHGFRFHHLGLAVKQPQLAMTFLAGLGYAIGRTIRDERQNVNLLLCRRRGMPAVEIIYPTETPGPLAPILKGKASSIYHICYETRCPDRVIKILKAQNRGVQLISPPQPAILFKGRKVSFYVVAGFGLIELLERA